MLAAVLGFAAATGACPTGSDWCYRSKVEGVEYVTFGSEQLQTVGTFTTVSLGIMLPHIGVGNLQAFCAEIKKTPRQAQEQLEERFFLADISYGLDKRAVEWIDACDTTVLDVAALAPDIVCNATLKECKANDGKAPSTTCEFDAVEVIDCPGGDDDDMALAIILSVVGVVVFSLAVVYVVYKRNAGESGPTAVTLL